MKPISNDLRRRIIEAIQANEESQPEIAERFSVALSTVEKLWYRFRVTGSYEPLPHSGGRKRLLEAAEELIRAEVASPTRHYFGGTNRQSRSRKQSAAGFADDDERRVAAAWVAAKKKMIYASERDLERVQTRRDRNMERKLTWPSVGRLKFLDEAGSNLAMTRLYGRAAPGRAGL